MERKTKMRIKKHRAHHLYIFLLFLAIGTVLDGITTIYAVERFGIMEQNPIANAVSPIVSLTARIAIITIVYYWGVIRERTNQFINIMVLIAAIWTWFIVFGNITVISFAYFVSAVP